MDNLLIIFNNFRFDHPVEHGLDLVFEKFWPIEKKKIHHG